VLQGLALDLVEMVGDPDLSDQRFGVLLGDDTRERDPHRDHEMISWEIRSNVKIPL
jgi:hypothetical protein